MFLGTRDYVTTEETELHKASYLVKPIDELSASKDLVFNGGTISRDDKAIRPSQERQCAKIKLVRVDTDFKSVYIQERARGAYIALSCQPEAVLSLLFAAQTT